jgi:hypothetical protein
MKPSSRISAKLQIRYEQLQDAASQGLTFGAGFWDYLQQSEDQLIEVMQNNPPLPNAPGSLEFSWTLYFFNNDAPDWVKAILQGLGMPASQITLDDWTKWSIVWVGEGALLGDGSLVSYAPFAVLDPGWSLALMNYMLLNLEYIKRHAFGANPRTLSVNGQTTLSIALFGDWGTGEYADGNLPASPSQLISQQITGMKPDISIHLGDVYYAGEKDEEESHLLSCWPKASLGNFTLNSNHEMYDGANGYFDTALASPIFSGQQNTSYFQIEFGNWLIIGLDTAYYDPSFFFFEGAISDPAQVGFLKQAAASGKKIMLLTHHNPLDITGVSQLGLWGQVNGALGGQKTPDYWYWGHQHNGIVYASGKQSNTGGTLCRCLGNGGIPIGNASWLANNPNVYFYTNEPLANPTLQQTLRVMNGFAMLQFTENDVTEQWYYQNGSSINLKENAVKQTGIVSA